MMQEILLGFIQNNIVLSLATVLGFLLYLFTLAIGFFVWLIRLVLRRYKDYTVIWKQPFFLRPKHMIGMRALKEQGFEKNFYFEREHDRLIREELNKGKKSILIVGNPLSGKTRAAYEAFKKTKHQSFVTIPKMDRLGQREFTVPFFFSYFFWVKKRRYLFLDDLNVLARTDRVKVIIEKYRMKGICIFATCRMGSELETDVGNELTGLFDVKIEIPKITDEEERLLETEIPKKTNKKIPKTFDHNIGSIFLKTDAMRDRYNNLDDDPKRVLHSIKRLSELGIYRGVNVFPMNWLTKVCQTYYSLDLESDRLLREKILKSLVNDGFFQREKSIIRMEEAYLDFMELEEKIELQDFMDAIPLFQYDPEALINFANQAIRRGERSLEKEAFMTTAIKMLKLVLEIEITKYNYADVKNSLGAAYAWRSEVRGSITDLETAITCYMEALEVLTFFHFPIEYASIQANLGFTYTRLVKYRKSVKGLDQALNAYREALRVYSLENTPVEYARTKNNQGTTYIIFALYENPKENLKKAIASFDEALKVRTLDRFPIDYAKTQNNLGAAYDELALYKEPVKNLLLAIESYNKALQVYVLDSFPRGYAETQNNLGNAYGILARYCDSMENLEQAVTAYKEALKIFTLDRFPIDYAIAQSNLGNAFGYLSRYRRPLENLKLSIEAYKEALKVQSIDLLPIDYARTQNNLGNTYRAFAMYQEEPGRYLRKSIVAFNEALLVRTRDHFPIQFARTMGNLAVSYGELARVEIRMDPCIEARKCIREALDILTEKEFPQDHQRLQEALARIEKICGQVQQGLK